MITIYAGIIDIDAETGEKSVRNDLFVPVNIPAIYQNFNETNGWRGASMVSTINSSYGQNNLMDGVATSLYDLIRGLTTATTYQEVIDLDTDRISFFTDQNVESEMGLKIIWVLIGQYFCLTVGDPLHGIYITRNADVTNNLSATIPEYGSEYVGVKEYCFMIPYAYKDATSIDELLLQAIQWKQTQWDTIGNYTKMLWETAHAPLNFYSCNISNNGVIYGRGNVGIWDIPNFIYNRMQNLESVGCWHVLLKGSQIYEDPLFVENPKSPYRFELPTAYNGISTIEFGVPLMDFPFSVEEDPVNFDPGRTETYGTLEGIAIREYCVGTDLTQLFDFHSTSEETILLNEEGAYIRKTQSGDNQATIEFRVGNKGFSFETSGYYAGMTPFDSRYGGHGLYIMVPSDWASIAGDKWIDDIPEDYNSYEWKNSPIWLFSTSYVGGDLGYYQYGQYSLPMPIYTEFWDYLTYSTINCPCMISSMPAENAYILRQPASPLDIDHEFWVVLLSGMPSDEKPYKPGTGSIGGGYSGEGGGQGGYDDSGDDITHSITTLDLSNSSLRMYKGSVTDIKDILTFINQTANEEKRQNFIGSLAAIKVFSLPGSAIIPSYGSENVGLCGKDTGVPMAPIVSQYATSNNSSKIPLGTFKVEEYFGTFMDYAPHTSVSLYLPYSGVQQLDVNEIMGKTCELDCVIDLMTGGIVYTLSVEGSVLYHFNGNVSVDIPVSATDYNGKISGTLGLIGSLAAFGVSLAALISMIPTSGATAPAAIPIAKAGLGVGASIGAAGMSMHELGKAQIGHTVRNGDIGSNNGNMSVRRPYLIITRPKQNIPATFAHEYGFRSHISARLGDLTGFTKVEDIHLEGLGTATKPELDEITRLLMEGVII